MLPKLNVLHLNINGLRSKLDLLQTYIKSLDLDIIALTETKLKNSISTNLINLDGYDCIRLDRSHKSGGGLLVYFKDFLKIEVVNLPKSLKQCEHLSFSVKSSRRKSLFFTLVYRPPNCNIDTFNSSLEHFLLDLNVNSPHCFLGDFNIDLSTPVVNPKAAYFLSILHAFNYSQTISEHTRLTPNKSSLLDLIILNDKISSTKSSVLDCNLSDHQATLLEWDIALMCKQQKHTYFTYRSFKDFSADKFNHAIQNCNWTNYYNENNPDVAWNIFTSNIMSVFDKLAPLKCCRIQSKRSGNKPWITSEVLNAMKLRDSLYKQFKNNRSNDNFKKYKIARNRVNTLVNKNRYVFFQNHFMKDNSGKSHWKTINNLLGKSSSPVTPPVSPNLFAEHFADIASHTNQGVSFSPTFESFLRNAPNTTFSFQYCSETDAKRLLRNLNCSRSCGLDNISNYMLKAAGSSIVSSLTYLFNLCISNARLPDVWKKAKVIPIFKKGPPTEPSNYRPISLLSSTSKLFERFLSLQLTSYFESNSLLSPYQHGFRSGHSTLSALISLTEHINMAIDKNKFVLASFLDLSKAFDTVHHITLLKKLSYYGINGSSLLLLKSYLTNRQLTVFLNSHSKSPFHNLSAGVPQGSVLGPLLFLIYTNDLQHSLLSSSVNVYADDTVIYSTSSSFQLAQALLINDLQRISSWFRANRLKLNVDKTQYIVFGTRHMTKHCPSLPITLNGTNVDRCKHVKYLGLEIDENLTFEEHISNLCSKLCRTLGPLNSIKHLIPFNMRKSVYQALILPHITYGITVWSTTSSSQLSRIGKILNRTCRQILSIRKATDISTKDCYGKLNWLNLDQLIIYHLYIDSFRLIHLQAPFNVSLPPRANCIHTHLTRSNQSFQRFRSTNSYGLKTLAHRTSFNWNSLPIELQSPQPISSFKKSLKQFCLQLRL